MCFVPIDLKKKKKREIGSKIPKVPEALGILFTTPLQTEKHKEEELMLANRTACSLTATVSKFSIF